MKNINLNKLSDYKLDNLNLPNLPNLPKNLPNPFRRKPQTFTEKATTWLSSNSTWAIVAAVALVISATLAVVYRFVRTDVTSTTDAVPANSDFSTTGYTGNSSDLATQF